MDYAANNLTDEQTQAMVIVELIFLLFYNIELAMSLVSPKRRFEHFVCCV